MFVFHLTAVRNINIVPVCVNGCSFIYTWLHNLLHSLLSKDLVKERTEYDARVVKFSVISRW